MNKLRESDHEWFRRHLPDHLLDLLVEGDRTRFESHVRRCAPCARLLSSALGARADWWDGAGHPPVGLLLEWDGRAGDAQREALREHVAWCESCRQDLADLRGREFVARLSPAPVATLPRRPRGGVSWRHGSAIAAVLVGVVAVALLWPRAAERAHLPARSPATAPPAPAPAPGVAPAAPSPAASPERTAEPVALLAPERGGATPATVVRIGPGIGHVALTLPMLDVPDEAAVHVELRDAAGALVVRQVLAAERATRAGGIVLPVAELADGGYVLHVRWSDPAVGEAARAFPLDVRLSR